jgi:DUF1009 family protein
VPPKLGILAGEGELPLRLAEACRTSGRAFFVVAFEGGADAGALADLPHGRTTLGAVGKTLELLRQAGCEEVVLAGKLRRPDFNKLELDRHGAALLAKLALKGLGDDAVLSAVVAELEGAGFSVVGAEEVMAELLAPVGAIGACEPDAEDRRDIDLGVRVARALGALDVGQAAVVRGGLVLGVEAQEGTDALLRRCAELGGGASGGVLVKLRKPGQERRVDLPTIGATTVAAAVAAGLKGIAVEAGNALIVDRVEVARAADAAGLFVVGIEADRDRE